MKKLFLMFSVVLFMGTLSFCQSGSSKGTGKAEMTFKTASHDFGKLKKGSDCAFDFTYKNTGDSILIITNVSTSCGCTTPDWTKEPIPSGKSGSIKVKYDSNRIGPFTKTITVVSNAKNTPVVLTITGNIEDVQAADQQQPK